MTHKTQHAIERLSPRVVGKNAFAHERIYAELFSATRPAAGGVVALAIGAIENALLNERSKEAETSARFAKYATAIGALMAFALLC